MATFTTIKKDEEKNDAKTVPATEFVERLVKIQQDKQCLKDVPYTEKPIDK